MYSPQENQVMAFPKVSIEHADLHFELYGMNSPFQVQQLYTVPRSA